MLSIDGIVAIIGALSLLITTFFTAWAAYKAKVGADVVKVETVAQTKKLDNITILVDGRYGEVLQELADIKRIFAQTTGLPADATKADVAQETADAQHARTAAANQTMKENL